MSSTMDVSNNNTQAIVPIKNQEKKSTNELQERTNGLSKRRLDPSTEDTRERKKRKIEEMSILGLSQDILGLDIPNQGLQLSDIFSYMKTCKTIYDAVKVYVSQFQSNYLTCAQPFFDTYIPQLAQDNWSENIGERYFDECERMVKLYTVSEPEKAIEYINKMADCNEKKVLILNFLNKQEIDAEKIAKLIISVNEDHSSGITDRACLEFMLELAEKNIEQLLALIRVLIRAGELEAITCYDGYIDELEEMFCSKIGRKIASSYSCEKALEYFKEFSDDWVGSGILYGIIKEFDCSYSKEIQKVVEGLEEKDKEPMRNELLYALARYFARSNGYEKSLEEYFKGFSNNWLRDEILYGIIKEFGYSHSKEIQEVLEGLEEKDIKSIREELRYELGSYLARSNIEKALRVFDLPRADTLDTYKKRCVEEYLIIDFDIALKVFGRMDPNLAGYPEVQNRVQERLKVLVGECIPVDLDRALTYNEMVLNTEERDRRYAQIVERLLPFDQEKAIQTFAKVENKKEAMGSILSMRAQRMRFFDNQIPPKAPEAIEF